MKACRVCGRLYPDDVGFCPVDGQGLYSATSAPPAPGEDDAGRVGQVMFGRYDIRRVVADGGMGRVYEALDTQENRHVAIKILHPDIASDEVAVARFKREFEVSAQLPSVHVVEVLDFRETPDGSKALVMEFLYGEELRSTLKREGALMPERVVRMLSQVALALDQAHHKALVHRDLKPENLFLCQTAEGDLVKVLDFGSVRDNTSSAQKLTVMGTTIGSPFYMPPEQAQGLDSLDHRADVWALGAIAYECLTGTVPFTGVNGPSILLQILTAEPKAPSQVEGKAKTDIPASVDRALLRALKKQVGIRTSSVSKLADDLGKAYGLEGDHKQWATTPESQLGEQIAERLPELLDATTAPKAAGTATDEFFGEMDGLGDSEPAPALAAQSGPPSSVSLDTSLVSPRPWLMVVAVSLVLVGALVAYLLL